MRRRICAAAAVAMAALLSGRAIAEDGKDGPPPPNANRQGMAERAFERMDRNHDGVIDKQEFTQGFERMMDRRHAARGRIEGRGRPAPAPDGAPPPPDAGGEKDLKQGQGDNEGGPDGPPPPSDGRGQRRFRQQRGPVEQGAGGSQARPLFRDQPDGSAPNLEERRGEMRQARVDQMLKRRDKNGDGLITPDEFPGPPERFKALDRNGDGKLDRDELMQGRGPMRQRARHSKDGQPPNPPPPAEGGE